MEKGITPNGQDFIAQINQIRANNPDRAIIRMGDQFWRIKARPGNQNAVVYNGTSSK